MPPVAPTSSTSTDAAASRSWRATTRHLSRIEAFERGEIVRVLGAEGLTMADAAVELGMSRATLYRKIAQYDIHVARDNS